MYSEVYSYCTRDAECVLLTSLVRVQEPRVKAISFSPSSG